MEEPSASRSLKITGSDMTRRDLLEVAVVTGGDLARREI
jgi:hypothetical protein